MGSYETEELYYAVLQQLPYAFHNQPVYNRVADFGGRDSNGMCNISHSIRVGDGNHN